MKTIIWVGAFIAGIQFYATASAADKVPSGPPAGKEQPYTVVERGLHHAVFERVEYATAPNGEKIPVRHQFIEMATGLNYTNSRGQLVESKAEISILPNGAGAMASQGQHKVIFPPNINEGLIELNTPEGKWLRSRVLGLSFFSSASGQSVLIAEIKDSIGVLQKSNVVVYPDAFDGVAASLRYTYTLSAFEQDVVIQGQIPSPAEWGLDPATTKLQVLTEFVAPPQPVRDVQETNGFHNEDLNFGVMSIGRGTGFELGDEAIRQQGEPVMKSWEKLDNRDFLIEELDYQIVEPQLRALPAAPADDSRASASPDSVLRRVASKRLLPAPKLATQSTNSIQFAKADSISKPGYVLDYTTVNSGSGYTFRGDTTYYLSSAVNLSGAVKMEGGAVLKYAANSSLSLPLATLNWLTTAYRPVIFTAKDDDSVGETLPMSTHLPIPAGSYFANPALSFGSGAGTIKNFRISYAQQAISLGYAGPSLYFYHGQIVNCANGITLYNSTGNFRNLLLANVTAAFNNLSSSTVSAHNLTVSGTYNLVSGTMGTYSANLVNSVLANITTLGYPTAVSGNNNGFYNCPTFGTSQVVVQSSPFKTKGAGNYYLALAVDEITDTSGFRNKGTTAIDTTLLADLKKKTTYPPVNPPVANPTGTTWPITAQRDMDTPDLGYHYDALDYWCSQYVMDGAPHTLAAGVAVGLYGNSGFILQGGGGIGSLGQANAMNHLVWYPSVQEQSASINGVNTVNSSVFDLNSLPSSDQIVTLRFTDVAMQGVRQRLVTDVASYKSPVITLTDCQLRGVSLYVGSSYANDSPSSSVNLQNNLLERCQITFINGYSPYGQSPLSVTLYNNTFWSNTVALTYSDSQATYHPPWTIKDNLLDGCSLSFSANGNYASYVSKSNNGYYNTTPGLLSGSSDVALTALYYATTQSGLGPWYINTVTTTPTLVNAGSRAAALGGLYHHTIKTSQVKEGDETPVTVDIGFHYLAVDASGKPVDTDGDALPDYWEDRNGNGTVDSGETDWQISGNGTTGTPGLKVFTPLY